VEGVESRGRPKRMIDFFNESVTSSLGFSWNNGSKTLLKLFKLVVTSTKMVPYYKCNFLGLSVSGLLKKLWINFHETFGRVKLWD